MKIWFEYKMRTNVFDKTVFTSAMQLILYLRTNFGDILIETQSRKLIEMSDPFVQFYERI